MTLATSPVTSPEAEYELIGAALYDRRALELARDRVSAADFHEPLCAALWAELLRLAEANTHAHPAALAQTFAAELADAKPTPIGFLGQLINRAPGPHAAPALATVVSGLATRRRIIAACDAAKACALNPHPDHQPHEIAAHARKAFEAIEQGACGPEDLFEDARHAGAARLTRLERELACGKPKGARTGLSAVDRRLGGLLPGSLVVVAGRPGMGKTALLGNILYGAAVENPTRLFAGFSLEMDKDQLSDRALSRLTAEDPDPIPYERLTKGRHTAPDLERLHRLKARLPQNLMLRDRAGLGVEDVERAVWWLKRRGDLAAIGIDYLQIMRRPRTEGRNEASVIGEMTMGLKTLARQAGVCVVLLSQLNRGVEARDDKRPMLSDLKDSGAIEQDADAVLFPFREVYYLLKSEPRPGGPDHLDWSMQVADLRRKLEVIVGKNRHGGEGVERQLYDADIDLVVNDVRGFR